MTLNRAGGLQDLRADQEDRRPSIPIPFEEESSKSVRRSVKLGSLPRVGPRDQNPDAAFWNSSVLICVAWQLSSAAQMARIPW